MRFVTLDTAKTLTVDLPERADATPTFVVKSPLGGTVQTSASVTLGTCNTTLSGAASAGTLTLTVTAATGIVVGRDYLVGGSEETGGEFVTVRALSGTTVTLVRPLRYARASGVAFVSTRVDMAIGASAVTSLGRHYRCEITWAVSSASQPTTFVPFDVTRYSPLSTLKSVDVLDLDPLLTKRLPAGTWLPGVIEQAWDMILRRLAQSKPPGALIGAIDLTTAHGYLTRKLLAETGGTDAADYADRMMAAFQAEFETTLASCAIDDDQDGAVEKHEGWTKTLSITRG
jgi:hypothetical protein